MPRNGSGVYSLPAGVIVANGQTIDANQHNPALNDFASDANTARPIVAGGTGGTSATEARANLGLAIGTNVQAFSANLSSLAGLTLAADKGLYSTGADTVALFDLTAAGRALLDDADAAAQRATLGLGGLATLDIIDEDDMASDSATRPPSQQSVKAYVDSQLSPVASGSFATSSAVDIPLAGAANSARVVIEITAASVSDAGLIARVTRDAFSSVLSGATDYRWKRTGYVGSSTLFTSDDDDTSANLITAGTNLGLDDTGPNALIELVFEGYANADTNKRFMGRATHIDQIARTHQGLVDGIVTASSPASAINGVRVAPTSGTVTGRWRVYYS